MKLTADECTEQQSSGWGMAGTSSWNPNIGLSDGLNLIWRRGQCLHCDRISWCFTAMVLTVSAIPPLMWMTECKGIPCKPHLLAYKGMARYGCRCFSKLQFTQQHNWEKIGDCSLIDNSKGYMLIKKFSQSDKIWRSWKYEGESMKLADSTPSPDHVTPSP
jgi:hypothetical protein